LGVSVFALGFAGITYRLFLLRRRTRTDAAGSGWRAAMVALAGGAALLAVAMLAGDPDIAQRASMALGVVLAVGVFSGVIGAMLQKILPFLITLRLAALGLGARLTGGPGERALRWQTWLQAAAVLLLLMAICLPRLALLAGVVLLAAQCSFAWNVWRFALAYRRVRTARKPNDTRA